MRSWRAFIIVIAAAVAMLQGGAPRAGAGDDLDLIPKPVQAQRTGGQTTLADGALLVLPAQAGADWRAAADVFAAKAFARFGVGLKVVELSQGEGGLECSDNELPAAGGCVPCAGALVAGDAIEFCRTSSVCSGQSFPAEEGYALKADQAILVRAESAHGLHNGLMTVLQLLKKTDGGAALPSVEIVDYPRFQWRGMLMDPARSFIPPDVMKKYIDLLSELKLNVLHWHLVDDQGWRIESKKFPKLHEVGGILSNQSDKKNRALDGHGWGRDGRGYYTQEELRDLVAYAKARQVEIVPEIDVPGHTSTMIAAYPDLQCSGEPLEVPKVGEWPRNAICPGKETVYEFLDELFGEVAEIFPSPYVHIGGDEVWTETWMTAPENQSLIEKHGFTGNDGLQAYFTERVNQILQKHGKIMIGWDEITGYLPEGSVVQAWRDHDYARQAAEKGHDAIVSPTSHCYIDYPQLTFTLKNLYGFEPIPAGLAPDLTGRVLGGEVNLWGERVTLANLDRKAFPRVIAHAEVMWTPAELRDWNDFTSRLRPLKKDMKARGVGFGKTWRDFAFML